MHVFFVILSVLFLFANCKSQQIEKEPENEVKKAKIEIKEPELEITSIAIIKADLVNTQFESVVKISNPNDFAVNLSSLNYELYGNGAFWASGKGENFLHIPALDSGETEFRFTMNFINMRRELLDDIIAMNKVNYRFAGTVNVESDLPEKNSFIMSFEHSGLSDVKENIDSKKTIDRKPNPVYTDNW